jgi:hypothetical protein
MVVLEVLAPAQGLGLAQELELAQKLELAQEPELELAQDWELELVLQGNHHSMNKTFPMKWCTNLQYHHLGIHHNYLRHPNCSNNNSGQQLLTPKILRPMKLQEP